MGLQRMWNAAFCTNRKTSSCGSWLYYKWHIWLGQGVQPITFQTLSWGSWPWWIRTRNGENFGTVPASKVAERWAHRRHMGRIWASLTRMKSWLVSVETPVFITTQLFLAKMSSSEKMSHTHKKKYKPKKQVCAKTSLKAAELFWHISIGAISGFWLVFTINCRQIFFHQEEAIINLGVDKRNGKNNQAWLCGERQSTWFAALLCMSGAEREQQEPCCVVGCFHRFDKYNKTCKLESNNSIIIIF